MKPDEPYYSAERAAEELLQYLETGRRPAESAGGNSDGGFADHSRSDACSSPGAYMRVAMGRAEAREAERLMEHAAYCADCCELLAKALRALEGAPSAEEAAAIAGLATAKAEWQKGLAKRLAVTPVRRRPMGAGSGPWWIAGGTVAALLAAGLFLWQRSRPTPEDLLALAYSESRTMTLRIPGAGFAAQTASRHTRGPTAVHEPAALLEAQAKLARELEKRPDDGHWLELQARADLLEERYDAAADELDRLMAAGGATPEMLVDAATAYFERGKNSGSQSDRATALDYLRRADELAPTDPLVLFNEAVVMEDRGQVINAVEVWNRYITVERDPSWTAEGRRRLAALELTLNRLKTHQSRVDGMLATPQAMEALAENQERLGKLDEELSSLELPRLLLTAFPVAGLPPAASHEMGNKSRGSPCNDSCRSARRLLKAISISLENQHHDFWLSDLLLPSIDSLPSADASRYSHALNLLGQAIENDERAAYRQAALDSLSASALFHQMGRDSGPLSSAGVAGAGRSEAEHLFGLQRLVDFDGCRRYAAQIRAERPEATRQIRYPLIEALTDLTEKVCDDTPELRKAARALEKAGERIAEESHYPLLESRAQLRMAEDYDLAGDQETSERLVLATLIPLYRGDPPPYRVAQTVAHLALNMESSPRAHYASLCVREAIQASEIAGNQDDVIGMRTILTRLDLRIGDLDDEKRQMTLLRQESQELTRLAGGTYDLSEENTELALTMLERGETQEAERLLKEVAPMLAKCSDQSVSRDASKARGLIALTKGDLQGADQTLESDIRASEGDAASPADATTEAEHAQRDRELYAELAATWLREGRDPLRVLALWERFRLRSRGLPIARCAGHALDCEEPALAAAQRRLGETILMGQVLLLDRVLVYRMDRNGVRWEERPMRQRDIVDSAQRLEFAVSSPATSASTAFALGAPLAKALLPALPTQMNNDAMLLEEPDPELANLSWPTLPTPQGALGLAYPLAESRSILARTREDAAAPLRAGVAGAVGQVRYGRRGALQGPSLLVGASAAAEDESPLPEAMEEARSVAPFLRESELLLGADATRARVARVIGEATVFHFAGHARQTPDGTELLLAASSPDEKMPWIDGAFLRQHPPRACRLAVLSACSTGRREASWNAPLESMAETLSASGIADVVATRWQIDSETSVTLMKAFYQRLSEGASIPVALRAARRVLFGQTQYSHPYYWGSYYASNNGAGRRKRELYGDRASLRRTE